MKLLFLLIGLSAALDIKRVVFVILSQENKYHLRQAENLTADLLQQSSLYKEDPVIHLSHRDFPHVGGWTVLPLIPRLSNLHKENSSWIFFLEDRTSIHLNKLLDALKKYDPTKEIWIGNALHDNEATIIHHFAFFDNPKAFKYPNMASGFAISMPLVNRLSERVQQTTTSSSDFSIDSSHELALFIWNKGEGQVLQHESALCNREKPHCAAFPTPFRGCSPLIPKTALYFAVKTCKKFHKDRIPVIKDTWAKHTPRIKFFSDVEDELVPTISLGIPNTEQGHCGKTMAILRFIVNEIDNDTRWIIIADDDTILSVSRMQQLLTCYDDSEEVALGERYGYNVHSLRGYNYITGGGGMVFSKPLLDKLAREGVCECPSLNTPDDMFLGICIASLGISVTHSPFFHQARPMDYSPGYLETQDAVSFHKHWMINPIAVYKKWFEDSDTVYANADPANSIHNEL